MHQIVDSTAFAQEFRITNNVKFRAASIIAFNRFGYFFASFYRHRTLIDDDPVIGENAGDLARDFFDEAKVNAAVALRWSRHRNENDLRVIDAFFNTTAETQPVRGDVAMNQFFQTGFVDRDTAGASFFNFARIVIDAGHVVTNISKAGAGDEADI